MARLSILLIVSLLLRSFLMIWVVVKIMVPFLGTLNIRCRIIIGTQKGTPFLTTTHMCFWQILPCKVGFHAGVVASRLFVLGSRAERNLLVNSRHVSGYGTEGMEREMELL